MFSVRSALMRLAEKDHFQMDMLQICCCTTVTKYNDEETTGIPGVGIEPTTPLGDQNLSLAP